MASVSVRFDPKPGLVVFEKMGRFIVAVPLSEAVEVANVIYSFIGGRPGTAPAPDDPRTPATGTRAADPASSRPAEEAPPKLGKELDDLRRLVAMTLTKVDGDRAGLLDLHQSVLDLQRRLSGTGTSAPGAADGGTSKPGAPGGPPAPAGVTTTATLRVAPKK